MPFSTKLKTDYIELFKKRIDRIPLDVNHEAIITQLEKLHASGEEMELEKGLDESLVEYVNPIKELYEVEMYLYPQQMEYKSAYNNEMKKEGLTPNFTLQDPEKEEEYLKIVFDLKIKNSSEKIKLKKDYEAKKYEEAKNEYFTILNELILSKIQELKKATDEELKKYREHRENNAKKRAEFEDKTKDIKPPQDPWILRKMKGFMIAFATLPESAFNSMLERGAPYFIAIPIYCLIEAVRILLSLPIAAVYMLLEGAITLIDGIKSSVKSFISTIKNAIDALTPSVDMQDLIITDEEESLLIPRHNNENQQSTSTHDINHRLQTEESNSAEINLHSINENEIWESTESTTSSRPISIAKNSSTTYGTFDSSKKEKSEKSHETIIFGRGKGQRYF